MRKEIIKGRSWLEVDAIIYDNSEMYEWYWDQVKD